MNEKLVTAIIAAVTSIAVVVIKDWLDKSRTKKEKQQQLLLTYLNPLRLSLEENYNRISEISTRIGDRKKSIDYLFGNITAEEVSEQNIEWFNESGCYLISTCYLTACLFYYIKKLRDDFSYLKLGKANDTQLWQLMFRVNRAFSRDLGIYYVIQYSIGHDMYNLSENRLINYREFCQVLLDKQKRPWFDRLIKFYLNIDKSHNPKRLDEVLLCLSDLSIFIEKVFGSSSSIKARMQSESLNRK